MVFLLSSAWQQSGFDVLWQTLSKNQDVTRQLILNLWLYLRSVASAVSTILESVYAIYSMHQLRTQLSIMAASMGEMTLHVVTFGGSGPQNSRQVTRATQDWNGSRHWSLYRYTCATQRLINYGPGSRSSLRSRMTTDRLWQADWQRPLGLVDIWCNIHRANHWDPWRKISIILSRLYSIDSMNVLGNQLLVVPLVSHAQGCGTQAS